MLLERRTHLDGLAVGMTGIERGDVRFGELGRLGEFRFQPIHDRRAVAVEHPERQPQRPHILAAQRFLVAEAERLHGVERQLRDVEMDELPFGEAAVFERVLVVTGLGEVARGKFALVRDDESAFAQRVDVRLQRRRVHRDEDIRLVARRIDRRRSEVDLEGADAEGRALRGADLGREIRESRKVVAR